MNVSSPVNGEAASASQAAADLRALFHRLNNQLGIVLAQAELLEAKSSDDMARTRAAEVVTSVLEAMGTAREIRIKTEPADA
jgi:hypothetical protein